MRLRFTCNETRTIGVLYGPEEVLREAFGDSGGADVPRRRDEGRRSCEGSSGFRTQRSVGLKSTGRWLRTLSRETAVQRCKDYVIVKLRKRVEELECDNKLHSRAFLSQGHARGAGFSKSVGRQVRVHRKGMWDSCACPNPNITIARWGDQRLNRAESPGGFCHREVRFSRGPLRMVLNQLRIQIRWCHLQRKPGIRCHVQAGLQAKEASMRCRRTKTVEVGDSYVNLMVRSFDDETRSRLCTDDLDCIGTSEG